MTTILMRECPFCGHFPDPDNYIDSFHPTGQGWRDDPLGEEGKPFRHYMRYNDPRGVHGKVWEMNCLIHEGGCGANITGDSREETIAAWNRRPDADPTVVSIHGHTIVGWLRGEKFMVALPTDDASNFMNLGYEPVIKVPPSTTFALPEA
jgi:hypothetical protein